MGGETRPEEARLQRRAHPQGRNAMKHPAKRGCARRDGPQAEAPATPVDEGRPTNRRRRVSKTRRPQPRHAIVTARPRPGHGARGRESGLERGRGWRSSDARALRREQGRTLADGRPAWRRARAISAPAAAAPRPRKSANAGPNNVRPLAPAQHRQSAPVRSRVPSASPPSVRRRTPHHIKGLRSVLADLEPRQSAERLGRGVQAIAYDPARAGKMAHPGTVREIGIVDRINP